MKKLSLFILLSVFFCGVGWGQRFGKNYPRFDNKKVHFGFTLGFNTSNFRYTLNADSSNIDSITNISIDKQPGFNLGIISSWDIHETVHLRFIPSLSFQERLFTYTYWNKQTSSMEQRENRLESTYLDFPLLLKLRTKRINNFAAYAIGGMQYSYDLASQKDVDQQLGDPIVKIEAHDWSYQAGGGFDFWLPYFKFGIELKISNGIKNVSIQDHSFFMDPLSSLKTKVWWFSLTFEG
ncbi:PorT family protein [Paracrocinitomix mangrovi]|uniref:type IX secretion/gliding motility protein PorT/SprT n=1 Tax=Paracrocinitomix mangrovi TaxID=2862509 RepID=UPI001C8DE165|nr:porin family protein [Paracrocinitomix mangrovi]UKN02834.1 PorT family protein [Paracrocinitomix mangrovi]